MIWTNAKIAKFSIFAVNHQLMTHFSRLLISSLFLTIAAGQAHAQSIFDLPELMLQGRQSSARTPKLDYDVEFHYYMDYGDYRYGGEVFNDTQLINRGRLTPSATLSTSRDRGTTHRLVLGMDVIKNMGEYPLSYAQFRESEMDSRLANTGLFKELIFHYNLEKVFRNGTFNLHAGVFPRSVRQGEYNRTMFSDSDYSFDPNVDGISIKYDGKVTFLELGFDRTGYKGYDRHESYLAYTAGAIAPLKWAKLGWAGTFRHVGAAKFYSGNSECFIFNPYLKFDAGQYLGMDALSLKAGAVVSYQKDRFLEQDPKFPVGFEAVADARFHGLGIENTYYYGDNMMPLYANDSKYPESIAALLYKGDLMYNSHRGYATFYDRLEIYCQPQLGQGVSLRASAIANFVKPNEAIPSLAGWHAKVSILFDLQKFNSPSKQPREVRTGAGRRNTASKTGIETRNI